MVPLPLGPRDRIGGAPLHRRIEDVQRGPANRWLIVFLFSVTCLVAGCRDSAPPPPARDELDAMSAIQRAHGHVAVDDGGHAVRVDFTRVDVRDADLAPLSKLTYLERANFDYAPIGDAGVAGLDGLTHLWALSLRGTKVTDAGLAHLQKCSSLRELDLEQTAITDAGLIQLAPVKTLRRIYVGPGGPVTSPGVDALKAKIPSVNVSRK
jgi:hypothetical protein